MDFVGWRNGTGNGSYGDSNFDTDHQARSGSDTTDLRTESMGAIGALAPDIALIQIGVNNIWGPPSPPGNPEDPDPYDPAIAMSDISQIIANLRFANPDVVVLVGELIPCDVGAVCERIAEMNGYLAGLVGYENTAQSPVVLVSLESQLTTADLDDGLHPNDAGDQKIATAFHNALTPIL